MLGSLVVALLAAGEPTAELAKREVKTLTLNLPEDCLLYTSDAADE